jgi:alpha-L-rhamnosidase
MRPTNEYNTDWSHGHAAFLVDGMPNNYDNDDCPADACPTVAAPMLRKEFAVHGRIVRAVLYNAALGMADVSINGHPVGNQVNGPPFSDYVKRVYYVTRDVTSLVRTGSNVIGAVLGNGFFSPPTGGFGDRLGGDGPPRFLSQLDITLADGTMQEIVTDPSWTWSRSEITFNDYWAGYMEDRTLAKPGWNTPDYAPDTTWQHVAETSALGGRLIAPLGPPVRVIAQVQPDRIVGNHAYFHVLTAGWPKITVAGHCGETVTINGINERLQFKLTQDGPTVLEPHFILTAGPLDLSVDGLTGSLAPGSVSLQCVAADLPRTGSFTSSNPFLNKVYQATLQTHLNYDVDFPADPTREKEGWTQDAQGFFDSAAYLTDVAGLYRRWWWDMADDQDPDGFVGSVLPVVGRHVYDWNSPWWSGVTVFIPWEHYLFYGDRRMLSEAYEPMRKYVDFLGLVAKSGIGERWDDYAYFNINQDPKAAATGMIMLNGAGDWLNPTTGSQFVVPAPMTTMPAYYYYATVVSRTAGLLGKTADEAKYAGLAADIKQRFNAAYFHTDSGLYGSETNNETAQVLPIAVGLVPDQYKNQAYQRLIDAIHARNDHVACGFVALPWLLQILTQNRETALVNKMVNQQDYPSWNSLMHDGILGEGWGGGGAQMPSTGGSIAMWMYQSTLGIRPDLTGPGFSRFILAPQPDTATGLTSASGYYDAAHGRIVSDWKQQDGQFFLRAVIPANTSATVTIPTNSLQSVLESGKPAAQQPGVKFVRSDADSVTYQVSSGEYHFVARVAVYVPPAALPITAKTSAGSCAAFEADLASKSLVALGQATCVSAVDSNDSGRSGSSNPDAIRNGTTLNGSGGPDTMNDGKTYRGYGSGSSLIFTLNTSLNPSGYDIDKIMTFAGHPDARASQSYAVSVSKVEAPQKFTTLILAAGAATSSGSSEIVIQTPTGGVISGGDTGRATGIAAVRFDFNDGPNGFNVYREIQIVGSPTKAVR